MLTTAQQAQLKTLTGQNLLNLIFTHSPGDGKALADFQTATANAGPTVVLLKVSGSAGGVQSNLPEQIIGGFNPQSWPSGINNTPDDSARTAIIFNLTRATTQAQNRTNEGAPDSGIYQSSTGIGVAGFQFGGPPGDIMVHWELYWGTAENYSFGGTSGGTQITYGGSAPESPKKDWFQVLQIDVYGLAPNSSSSVQAPSGAKVIVK